MLEKALALGMTEAEYLKLLEILGRVPSTTELAMVSVEWSEHCGYPRSRALLKLLPKDGHYASVAGADTGGIEVEPGLFVVFKMESHNHPSQVEPRQGAATGIGGIIRDIFTVGARPIANLNSLRFGMLDDPDHGAKARYLFQGVVDGISFYGNCLHGDETITIRQGAQIRTVALGEWCETAIKEGREAHPVAEVLSFDETMGRASWNQIEGVFRRQTKELVTVSSHLGRKWRVTADHPMLVWNCDKWQIKAAGELQKGDKLPLLGALPASAKKNSNLAKRLDLIEILGARRPDIRVIYAATKEEKGAIQAVLRRYVASAQKRFAMISAGRFPVAVWLELEKTLGWQREKARLVLFGGQAQAVPALIEVDGDFARLLGYYSAEGCLSQNGTTSKIIWTFGAQEDEYIADLSTILTGLGLRFSHRCGVGTQSLWLSSWFLGALWRELGLGADAKTKRVPSLIFEAGSHLKQEFLRGAFRGDGSVSLKKEGSSSPVKIGFATASRALFEGVQLLLAEQSFFGSTHTRAASQSLICGRIHQTAPLHVVEFSAYEAVSRFAKWFDVARNAKIEAGLSRYRDLSQSYARHHKAAGFATVAVTQIEREAGDFTVYDLRVADTHLFVTSGGLITHNCMGIPTVAGEIGFNPSYRGNCLVGAMSVGVVKSDEIASSAAAGIGNTVMYFGNATGRDGIGGCSVLASHEITDLTQRPTVQVGDPFAQKCLLEATLEALRSDAIVSMKDMGAAGLTCTTCEQAASGGPTIGMDIDLDKVPLREADMEAYEIMMSESQERMLGVVKQGREAEIIAIFEKWNTHAVPIGTVTDDGLITVRRLGEVVAEISAESLVESPLYHLPSEEPAYFAQKQKFDFKTIAQPKNYGEVLLRLLAAPNIASKEWAYEQYDHLVQINTIVRPGAGDAAVLRLRDSKMGKGLAVKADCNSRYVYLDPFVGAQIAIAECARNLICVGAEPAGVTDCLCFGNPEKPDRFWQFKRSIEGISAACSHFRLPVVSGNVSLYNETPESVIHPSPLIGMVGVLQNVEQAMEMRFRDAGDLIILLGQSENELGSSEYLFVEHGLEEGAPPHLDLVRELNVQRLTLAAIRRGLVKSAHDVSDGGLAVCLAECCITGEVGAAIELSDGSEAVAGTRLDALLFGETQSRVVLSVAKGNLALLQEMARVARVPVSVLGTVGGEKLSLSDGRMNTLHPLFNLPVAELSQAYRDAIGALMAG